MGPERRVLGKVLVRPGSDQYPSLDRLCFLCSKPFDGVGIVVMWAGPGHFVYLHGQRCASSFVLRLGRDAWEVEHEQRSTAHPAH